MHNETPPQPRDENDASGSDSATPNKSDSTLPWWFPYLVGGVAAGSALGTIFGGAFGNVAMGVSLGPSIGMVVGLVIGYAMKAESERG